MPKLSIIIPTFNSACTIQRCLWSIGDQTFTDYEVIIQDGLSTDDTLALIRSFKEANPHLTIEIRSERDAGVYDAMNKAIRRAEGEWLYFLGSDDELSDGDVLSTMMNAAQTSPCDVLYGNVRIVGNSGEMNDGSIYDGGFSLAKLLHKNICHQSIFYRRSLVAKLGGFNLRYVLYSDWDLNLRCWALTQFRFVDAVVAKYSLAGFSNSGLRDEIFEEEMAANVIRYLNLSMFSPLVNRMSFYGFPGLVKMHRSTGFWCPGTGRALRALTRRVNLLAGRVES